MSRNLVSVELRGNELRDAPLQKNGLLRGKRVTFDVRKGTPLADVSGAVAPYVARWMKAWRRAAQSPSIPTTASTSRRAPRLDVSGGVVKYSGGVVDTTKLISGGRLFDISEGRPWPRLRRHLRCRRDRASQMERGRKLPVVQQCALPTLSPVIARARTPAA